VGIWGKKRKIEEVGEIWDEKLKVGEFFGALRRGRCLFLRN
jgi:hypothetical protein